MFKDKKVIAIVATGNSGEIGKDNALLWHIRAELQHFKQVTLGNVLLMGRKTVESLPQPLKGRIVVEFSKGNILTTTIEDALDECSWCCDKWLNTDTIYVCGGGQTYKSAEKYTDAIILTRIGKSYPDADTFYNVPDGFKKVGDINVDQWEDAISNELLDIVIEKWERVE